VKLLSPARHVHRSPQRGAAAVEFALVATLFFTVLFGVIEMGRLLWIWNAAVEATRFGARMAVVCDINDTDIVTRMQQRLPGVTGVNIAVDYLNPPAPVNTCTTADCKAVRVSLSGYVHQPIIPFVPLNITLPPFATTLRKEFMQSASNPVCN
jgi:Flp pilus assembly protein TadG